MLRLFHLDPNVQEIPLVDLQIKCRQEGSQNCCCWPTLPSTQKQDSAFGKNWQGINQVIDGLQQLLQSQNVPQEKKEGPGTGENHQLREVAPVDRKVAIL